MRNRIKTIQQEHSSLDQYQKAYMEIVTQLPLFKKHVFSVSHKNENWDFPQNFDIHIQDNGIQLAQKIPNSREKRILRQYTFDEIENVSHSENNAEIIVVPYSSHPDETSILFNSLQGRALSFYFLLMFYLLNFILGFEISNLINKYMQLYLTDAKYCSSLYDIPQDLYDSEILATKKGCKFTVTKTKKTKKGTFVYVSETEKIDINDLRFYREFPKEFAKASLHVTPPKNRKKSSSQLKTPSSLKTRSKILGFSIPEPKQTLFTLKAIWTSERFRVLNQRRVNEFAPTTMNHESF